MRANKNQPFNQIKTWNSQQSDIDLFSKMQGNFLEKFFRYNVSDYFQEMLSNLYEDQFDRKLQGRASKTLATQLFICRNNFTIEEFQQKIQNFYRSKSKTIDNGELPYAFRLKYCNRNPMPNMIKKNQLVFIEVKIKVEVNKIQELPLQAIKIIQNYRKIPANNKCQDGNLDKFLSNYREEFITLFICYFGDSNFHIFNKTHYQTVQVRIFNKVFKLRIFVFFVSRKAMIETFKSINKISNLQYINDLVIQFYEEKRIKHRKKKAKKNEKVIQFKGNDLFEAHLLKFMGAIGLVAAGFFLVKVMI